MISGDGVTLTNPFVKQRAGVHYGQFALIFSIMHQRFRVHRSLRMSPAYSESMQGLCDQK